MKNDLPKQVISFLQEPNYMVIGTIGKNGIPQLTTVWFSYEDGLLNISITKTRVKYKNILRDPRVGCLIYDTGNPYRYLQIKGQVVKIEEDPEYKFGDFLCARYGRDENYRKDPVHKKEGRLIIRIKPETFYSKGL